MTGSWNLRISSHLSWTNFCYVIIVLASLAGSLITALTLLAGLFATWQLVRHRRQSFPLPAKVLAVVFLTYFSVLTFTTALNGPDPARFIELGIISPFLLFAPLVLVASAACTDITLRGIGRAAMLGLTPVSLVVLWVSLVEGGYRPALAAGNPNVTSTLMTFQIVLCLAGWVSLSKHEKIVAVFCAGLGCIALVVGPSSRGAMMALTVLICASLIWLVFAIQNRRKSRLLVGTLICAMLVFAALAFRFFPFFSYMGAAILDPTFSDWSSSESQRLMMYGAALEAIAEAPLIGHGMHMRFTATLPYYASQPPPELGYFTHVHNVFLTHGVAAGWAGIVAVFVLLLTPLLICRWPSPASMSVTWLGMMASLGVLSLGVTETVLFQDLNTSFTMFLFVVVAVFASQELPKPRPSP